MLIRKPQIIFVAGHPGSGKTTLANNLAEKLNWPVLSVAHILKGLGGTLDLPVETLVTAATAAVIAQVEQAGRNANRVIVDMSTNIKREWPQIDAIKDLWPRIKFLPLFLLSDFDTCEAQLIKRISADPLDVRKKYVREKFVTEFENYVDFEFRGLIKMEARRPEEDILKNAVALIYANLLT